MPYLLQWGCPENTVPWLHFSGIVSIKMNSPHALQMSCPMEVQFPLGNAFTGFSKRLGCQSGVLLCNPRDHGDLIAMFNVGRACSQTQSHVYSKTSKHPWGWREGTRLCTCLAPQHLSLGTLPLNWEAWMAGGCLPDGKKLPQLLHSSYLLKPVLKNHHRIGPWITGSSKSIQIIQ